MQQPDGTMLEESLALRRELEDKRGIAWSLNDMGRVASDQGDYRRAAALSHVCHTCPRSGVLSACGSGKHTGTRRFSNHPAVNRSIPAYMFSG